MVQSDANKAAHAGLKGKSTGAAGVK